MSCLTFFCVITQALGHGPLGTRATEQQTQRAAATTKAHENARSIMLVAVDKVTRLPLKEYTFTYEIETADGKGDRQQKEVVTYRFPAEFPLIQVPPSCRFTLRARSRDSLSGYGHYSQSFVLRNADTKRTLVVELARGTTIRGKVVDTETKQPVKGARVCPIISCIPMKMPDTERSVVTDAQGSFVVPGADPSLGISVLHPDYLWGGACLSDLRQWDPTKEYRVPDIQLDPGETIGGNVSATDGKALPGVEIFFGYHKKGETSKDGSFILKGVYRNGAEGKSYDLCFAKEGFISASLKPATIPPNGLRVVLDPAYRIQARVLSPGGKPVGRYLLMTGPGHDARDYQLQRLQVDNPTGSCTWDTETAGPNWVGVRVDDYAIWEGVMDVSRKNLTLDIRLNAGATMTGKARVPSGPANQLEVTLVPERAKENVKAVSDTDKRDLGSIRALLALDGSFRLGQVRPGRYELTISGTGVTPLHKTVTVTDKGAQIGRLELQLTGQIVGQVGPITLKREDLWAFARGEILLAGRFDDGPIPFRSDENGRFSVANVPAGEVMVRFPVLCGCFLESNAQTVLVSPGKTTSVTVHATTTPSRTFPGWLGPGFRR